MKKLFTFITLAFLVTASISCEKEGGCSEGSPRGTVPSPPYGTPSDTDRFNDGDYISITYYYYCYNGKYRAVTYTSIDRCTPYERSDFTTSCLKCD